MKLKSLWIDGYKNLIDSRIEFEANASPIAIIGNNGTGKSNLIEALLHIFTGLYYNTPPEFDFEITYTAHGKTVQVVKRNDEAIYSITVDGDLWPRTRFKKRIRETEAMPPFPALIFGYYSGTCERIEKLLKRYERTFSAKLRFQSKDLQRNFVFSNIDQAKWILLSLIAHRHESLLNRMSVAEAVSLKITIQPPRNYDPNSQDIMLWDTTEGVREFLALLRNNANHIDGKQYQKDEEYHVKETSYYFSLTELSQESIADKEVGMDKVAVRLKKLGTNLYSMLQAFHSNKMLVNVEYELKHIHGDKTFSFDDLSEGEKQLLCVIGGLTMAQHKECLVLLDEPDTHLNPAWSWEYNSLLENALRTEQRDNSTILLATHDPVLISGLNKEQVLIAHNRNNKLFYEQPHRNPRGQGIANVLTSEFFGLPSSLDINTQKLLDDRLKLAYKPERLTDPERNKLESINLELKELGLTISFRDPKYKDFEENKYGAENQE